MSEISKAEGGEIAVEPAGWTPEMIRAWRDAALADGWTIEPTYPGGESVDSAARMHREGFTVALLLRSREHNIVVNTFGGARARNEAIRGTYSIHVWCPRGIDVTPPREYSFAALVEQTRVCPQCGARDVDTVRIAFAGRSCQQCAPAQRAIHERGNWTN